MQTSPQDNRHYPCHMLRTSVVRGLFSTRSAIPLSRQLPHPGNRLFRAENIGKAYMVSQYVVLQRGITNCSMIGLSVYVHTSASGVSKEPTYLTCHPCTDAGSILGNSFLLSLSRASLIFSPGRDKRSMPGVSEIT